ncbi:hypothetical protein ACELLULO517_09155 [Acidisoma cellulosilytica]|uniref:Uncharacterized protein n=1 Tax=Acidisoma cellulosilyticum TaxID=2802395 RepID=A0A964E3X7_9PROT|nr:hypothetical protein [Acidisoma cellulosilyticum]MCB8880398.1 hypothetical protein [Acidisoma cellulosilyticum]
MQPEVMPLAITNLLHHPELRLLLSDLDISIDERLAEPFLLLGKTQILIGKPLLSASAESLFHMRHAMELAWLSGIADPALAGLAAARCAALAVALETYGSAGATLPGWIAPLTGYAAPDLTTARRLWAKLAVYQHNGSDHDLTAASHAKLIDAWSILGPSEWLMEQGGDARLGIDPFTGLNGYGCSHRPRPWAVTFASSTASSVSERGYLGAEAARRRMITASFGSSAAEAIFAEADRVREALAYHFDLARGTGVILAPSGTDAELISLALASAAEDRPITNILLAPEETGSGVPLAARGQHFALDTALGVAVPKAGLVEGFRPDTALVSVALRDADGAVRPPAAVEADCTTAVEAAIALGRRPILHILDVSKTGLRAPRLDSVMALWQRFGTSMDVIVDACQTRLHPGTIRDYLARGWMVLITGSKFFTGPPFSGALLAPAALTDRLATSPLPTGLALYSGRAEWRRDQAGLDCLDNGPSTLGGNYGLVMRWQAALAEMQAFAEVPGDRRRAILHRFVGHVERCIAAKPGLTSVNEHPAGDSPGDWDLTETIRCFALRLPAKPAAKAGADQTRFLDLAAARKVYIWLNADLTDALAEHVSDSDQQVLRRRCHIGQPVAVTLDGEAAAALRVSAGARLVSGEPSLAHLAPEERLERELADVTVLFRKIALILRHFDRLSVTNPRPSYD